MDIGCSGAHGWIPVRGCAAAARCCFSQPSRIPRFHASRPPRLSPLLASAKGRHAIHRGGENLPLVLAFVGFAVANRVSNRLLLVPMAGHSLALALATSVVQLLVYTLLLAFRIRDGFVTRQMLDFAVRRWPLFVAIGVCEGSFYPLVFASSSKLPGGLVQVLNQTVVPYTLFFSVVLLGRRFSSEQLLGVVTVLAGVLLAAGPSERRGRACLGPVLQCAGAYGFLAMAVTLKDLVFASAHAKGSDGTKFLDTSLVCASAAAVQLLVQLLALPALLPGSPRLPVIAAGLQQLAFEMEPVARWLALTYWMCNVAFSLAAMRLVRQASAATVVLSNVAALPLSALLFCCPLPLLRPEAFRWKFVFSLLVIVAGNLLYGSSAFQRPTAAESQ